MSVGKSPPGVVSGHRALLPDGWPKPKGYANGMVARGTFILLGGQVGWNTQGQFPPSFVGQVHQALRNIATLLKEAGADPHHVVRLVWYVTDMDGYAGNLKEIGRVYREVFGHHYPAMSLVQVVRLVEPLAKVEIEATAVLPD